MSCVNSLFYSWQKCFWHNYYLLILIYMEIIIFLLILRNSMIALCVITFRWRNFHSWIVLKWWWQNKQGFMKTEVTQNGINSANVYKLLVLHSFLEIDAKCWDKFRKCYSVYPGKSEQYHEPANICSGFFRENVEFQIKKIKIPNWHSSARNYVRRKSCYKCLLCFFYYKTSASKSSTCFTYK